MKNLMTLVGVFGIQMGAFQSAHAGGAYLQNVLECHTHGVADAGYSVRLVRDLTNRQLKMSVSEITFVGSHLLGESRVGVKKDRLGTAFVGVNLKLIVANGNISVQQPYVTTGFLSGDAVSSRFARLTCQVMDPQALVLSRPTVPTGPTCMAYFEGFAFNAVRERCEFTGMSGCSNPFEFKTLNSCESDFSLR